MDTHIIICIIRLISHGNLSGKVESCTEEMLDLSTKPGMVNSLVSLYSKETFSSMFLQKYTKLDGGMRGRKAKGWEVGVVELGGSVGGKEPLRRPYPVDLFNSALSRIEKEIVTEEEKGVNSPETPSDKGKTGMRIIVINVSEV